MADTYLQRTFTAGDRKTWTMAFWVKRGKNAESCCWSVLNSSDFLIHRFEADDDLDLYEHAGGTTMRWTTKQKCRDYNGWYHIVVKVDTTQSTEADRFRMYVNGVETESATPTYYVQDQNTQVGFVGGIMRIGTDQELSNDMEGAMAQFVYADGTAYAPTTFGSFDSTTGEWKPKSDGEIRSAVTFGTNGCLLPFSNASYPGYDYQTSDRSGTTNDYTFNGSGFQCKSNPSNNFAVLDHNNYSNSADISKNMCRLNTASNGWFGACSTMGFKKGFACYFETKLTAGSKQFIGVSRTNGSGQTGDPMSNETEGTSGFDYMVRTTADDTVFLEGTNLSGTFSQATTGDIVAMSVSAAGEVKIYKNDTLQYTWSTALREGFTYFPIVSVNGASVEQGVDVNYGEGYFGTTAVSSANADPNGIGAFEYTTKSCYALCTKNLKANS